MSGPETAPDPFEERRNKLHARISIMRKLGEGELTKNTVRQLDEIHAVVAAANPSDKESMDALAEAEERLETLEDDLDSGEMWR